MYGEATFIKVNQLRYDSFSQKYQGTAVQVLIVFNDVFLFVKLIAFLLLPECHLKRIFEEPSIRNSYRFPNDPSR